MARLQIPTQQQIAPGQVPGVQAQAPAVRSGEIAAQQGGQLAQALGEAAQQAARIQVDVLERGNQLRVNDAMNQLRRHALDLEYGQDGFRSRVGENALPAAFEGRSLTEAYSERYRSAVDELDSSLGNDVQRQMFRQQADQLGLAVAGQAQAHELAEFRRYGASVLDGGIALAVQEAAVAYDNPQRVAAAISNIGALTEERLSEFSGLSPNERAARIQVMQSTAIMGTIQAAADAGDLSLARNYYETYADRLTAEDRTRYDAMMTPALDAQLARSAVAAALSGEDLPDAPEPDAEVVLAAPVDGRQSSAFGPRVAPATRNGRGSSNHGGVDFAVPVGTPVRAAGQGRVTFAGERGGYGNLVIIQHPDGRETRYAHLSEINVREGQTVDGNAVIAASGDTGNTSGPHLHFEVFDGGVAVDPAQQLGRARPARERQQRGVPQTRAELEAAALAAVGDRPTPEQVAAIRREAAHVWGLQEEAREQQQAQDIQRAQEWLVANNGNFAAMPASMRASIPADSMDDVIRFAEAVDMTKAIETPPEVYYLLYDDNELAGLTDAEFLRMRGRIAPGDWERAAQRRQALRNPRPEGNAANPDLVPRERLNAVIDPYFADLGLSRGGQGQGNRAVEQRRRAGAVLQVVEQTVLDAQRQAGRQLDDQELRGLVGRLFQRQDVIDRGLFGGRQQQPLFQTNAGQIRRTPQWREIDSYFERQGIRNPTDSQVETAYYRLKMGLPIR